MRKHIALFCLLSLVAICSLAWADLDETSLKVQIAQRVSRITGIKEFSPSNITIEEKHPIILGDMEFWAVRLKLEAPDPKQDPGYLLFVTDPEGKYQFSRIALLSNGKNVLEDTLSQMKKLDLQTLTKEETLVFQGKGKHDVVLISDPFCPYCRKTYAFLQKHKDKIRRFSLLHFPLKYHQNSNLLCALMIYCQEKNILDAETYRQLVNFIYKGLHYRKDDKDGKQTMSEILEKFPKIKNHFESMGLSEIAKINKTVLDASSQKLREEQETLRRQAISATPTIAIDGHRIDGFKTDEILRHLE